MHMQAPGERQLNKEFSGSEPALMDQAHINREYVYIMSPVLYFYQLFITLYI